MTPATPHTIRRLLALGPPEIDALASLLIDCVEGGASVGFMLPLSRARATQFWEGIASDVANGARAVLVAEDPHGICGTAQLVLAQPDNQPHRADLSKMLVHRRVRRQGLGAALMTRAEQVARDYGKTLLVLDTITGSAADRLYTRLGWSRVGEIPDYAHMPEGGLESTTVFYRRVER